MFLLSKFTKKEKKQIKKSYKDWNEIENEIWVEDEIESHMTPYIKKYLEFYPFAKKYSEKMWLVIKLSDFELHTSDWIEEKIRSNKTVQFKNFDDEVLQRIDLEECEKHRSEFIDERLKNISFLSFSDELRARLTLEECEKHQSTFIERNLEKYKKNINSFDDELHHRITLENSEKFQSEFVDKELQKLIEWGIVKDVDHELQQRIWFVEYERKKDEAEKKPIKMPKEFWDMLTVDGLRNQSVLRDELNKVGKGFCLAKWNQVSILLQTGQTHSCHHPRPHQVPLEELIDNPSALHNTKFKKEQRKMMLEGERPPECDYCWNVEDANKDAFSDRIMKSGEAWAFPHFDSIKKLDYRENIQPTYVEISFSNQCNMACGYCDAKSSSRWQAEINRYGHYPTSGMFNNIEWMEREGIVPIPHTKPNPYREAFWKWWPDLFPTLHTFRVTGGEPLLAPDMFKVLDYIIEHPNTNPSLEMSVNTNLCPPQDRVEEFIDKIRYITDNNLLGNFTLFTSIEANGKQAEYMRDGMESDRFWNNLDLFLTKCQKPGATIMATYNITSVSTYDEVIKKVLLLKDKHYNGKRYRRYAVMLDTSYLRHPEFLSVRLLPKKWINKIKDDYKLMLDHSDEKYVHIKGHGHCGFYEVEVEKLRRVIDVAESPLEDIKWLMKQRRDFALYIDEFDKRRGKNFLKTFPDMKPFYNSCKRLV